MAGIIELTKPITGESIFINLDLVEVFSDISFTGVSGTRLYFYLDPANEIKSRFIDVSETVEEIREILCDEMEEEYNCDCDDDDDEEESIDAKFQSEE